MNNFDKKCSVCGWKGQFVRNHNSVREGYCCGNCRASLRYREQTKCIIDKFSDSPLTMSLESIVKSEGFAELSIYEPGIIGPFRKYFNKLKNYHNSYYWPEIECGGLFNGVVCQNLESLTYDENSFDLVITSDILEHVRQPSKAFSEIYRVLKPGGYHIFTVPILWPLDKKTVSRVETSTSKDIHILPPHYHSSPVDKKGSLVYTDFGIDILSFLDSIGFITEYHGLSYNVTFCSRK